MIKLTIEGESMTSNATPHTAQRTNAGWVVTWLPDRALDRNQAITAMTIAQVVARPKAYEPHVAGLIESFASELGLTGPEAAELAR